MSIMDKGNFKVGDFVKWNAGKVYIDSEDYIYGGAEYTTANGVIVAINNGIAKIARIGYKMEITYVKHSLEELQPSKWVLWYVWMQCPEDEIEDEDDKLPYKSYSMVSNDIEPEKVVALYNELKIKV